MIRKLLLPIILLLSFSATALIAQSVSHFADSLEQLLPEVQDPASQLQLLIEISRAHYDWEAYELSKQFAHRAIRLAQQINAPSSTLEQPLLILATTYYEQHNQDSCRLILPSILKLCSASGNTDCLIQYYNTMALMFDVSVHPDSSLFFYQKALSISEDDPLWQDLILSNMGVIFSSLNLTERARTYYKKAYRIALAVDDSYMQGLTLLNIGYTFINDKQLDSADYYLSGAYPAALASGYTDILADVHCYMGLSQLRAKNLSLADSFLHLADQAYTDIGLERHIAETLPYLAELYFEQGLVEKARTTALLSIDLNKGTESEIYLLDAFRTLSKIYRAAENYQLSDQYTQAYNDLQDTMQRQTLANQFSTLEMDYQLAKKEAQIQLITAQREGELRTQKLTFFSSIGLLFLLGTIIYLLFRQSKRRRYQNQWLETQVKERTAELNKANEELKNYLEEMTSFTHITSHDLKEPLRNISSFTSLLERRLGQQLSTEARDFMHQIKENAHQMHRLIEGILYYSTLDAKDNATAALESVDLLQLLSDIKRILATTIDEHQAILHYPDTLPIIESSPEALQVIIKNIVENGIKYNRSDQPEINIEYEAHPTEHHLIIRDNGIGVEPQYQQQIFQMFKRLHNQQEFTGTGMGLAICRKLLRRLGGDIELQSTEGEGSTFTVILPIKEKYPLAESD